MKVSLFVFVLLPSATLAQVPDHPRMEPIVALDANVPLPKAWLEERPVFAAATIEESRLGWTAFIQVDPTCNSGVHAHRRQVQDTIRILVHFGLDREEPAATTCFSSCDRINCPILYRYEASAERDSKVVEVYLDELLLARANLSTN